MSGFAFRQRVGGVDWRAITSVETEEIVLKADTRPLQCVLDIATFSNFGIQDVKSNSVDSICKFVNILQLISEYLLHCQEAQFKVIRDLQEKNDVNKDRASKLKKEILSLKEDRKIYQRQLAMLRKSLGPDNLIRNSTIDMTLPPKITNLLSPPVEQASSTMNADIIQTILRHEDDTRLFMTSLLNDQRNTFMEQINTITETLRHSQQIHENKTSTPASSVAMASKLEAQMESSLLKAVETMQQTVTDALNSLTQEQRKNSIALSSAVVNAAATAPTSAAVIAAASGNIPSSSIHAPVTSTAAASADTTAAARNIATVEQASAVHKESVANAIQAAALEQFERELDTREAALKKREREISSKAEAARASLEMSLAARRASDTERLDLLTTNESLTLSALTVGARSICNIVKHALLRKKIRAFRSWYTILQHSRDAEMAAEHAKRLVYVNKQASLRESEVQLLLEKKDEENKENILKMNQLYQELSIAESKIKDFTSNMGRNNAIEGNMEHLLLSEREKLSIQQARYNTLKTKTDHEINELKEKIQLLERKSTQDKLENMRIPTRDSAMMTSTEQPPSTWTAAPSLGHPVGTLGPTAGALSVSTPASRHHPGFSTATVGTSVSLHDSSLFPESRWTPSWQPDALRKSTQQRFLSTEAGSSEYDLWTRVQQRVAHRRTPEEIEAEAMASLAAEIEARLAGDPTSGALVSVQL